MQSPPYHTAYLHPSPLHQLSSPSSHHHIPTTAHPTTQEHLLLQQQEVQLRRRSTWSCGDYSNSGHNTQKSERQEENIHENQPIVRAEIDIGNRRDGQKYKNNYNPQYQAQQYSYNNWRYRQQYGKPNIDQSSEYKENQKQLARLQELNKEARSQKIYRQNICSLLKAATDHRMKNPIQLLKEVIAERQKAHRTDSQANTQLIDRLYQQSRKIESEHEQKYKHLGVYLRMNKQKEENEKLLQNLTRKEAQLKELTLRKESIAIQMKKRSASLTMKIQETRQSIKKLGNQTQKAKLNLQKWAELRFKLNLKCGKQERLNNDIAEKIRNVDEHIRKEAEADERIRLGNLKLMENLQCQHEDLNHEKLRKLEEKNHELKLLILNASKILQEKTVSNIVPSQLIEKKENQIRAWRLKIACHEKTINAAHQQQVEIRQLNQKISALENKQKLKQECDIIKLQIEELEAKNKEVEAENEQGKVNLIKMGQEVKLYSEKILQIEKEIKVRKQKKKQKEMLQSHRNQEYVWRLKEEKQGKESRNLPKNSRQQHGKRFQKLVKQQAAQLNTNTFVVEKKLKPVSFIFTVSYLAILFFIAVFYNEVQQHLRKFSSWIK